MVIDVIIPTYNRATTIKRAIDSVLAQTYPHLKIYICDDGSTDETSSILEKFSLHPFIKISSQKNAGASAARNHAVQMGNSPWLAFLDSDDVWHPTKCQEFIEASLSHPSFSFFHCEEEWIKNDKLIELPRKFNKNSNSQDFLERSLQHTLISTSTVMLSRSLFSQLNGFDERLKICEDYDLWNKILLKQPIYFINKKLVTKFGGHSDQLSTQDPCLDLYRVKSLANLLSLISPESPQWKLVLNSFEQKSTRLLDTLKKHERLEDLEDVRNLMSRLVF